MRTFESELIDRLAGKQLGLVTRAQLLERGISSHVIAGGVRAKRLHMLHRGVYRVGPLVVPNARELAALLACGPNAALSHRSAGWIWQWLPDPGDSEPVDVSVCSGNGGRRRPHIRVHRVILSADEVTSLHGLRVTSATRTVIDLSGVLDSRELEQVISAALRANLVDARTLNAVARCAGAALLRTLVSKETGPAWTRSEAESRFLALIRKARLPVPETNVRVVDYEVDFLWRRERVIVEIDGFAFHSSHSRFENDRRRDARLTANGFRVLRVTWKQLADEWPAVLVHLVQTLARAPLDAEHGRHEPDRAREA